MKQSMTCKRCCRNKKNVRKGRWTPEEDMKLTSHVTTHGVLRWRLVPSLAGLDRCGKSCRLRWVNYLRPGLRTHNFSSAEIAIILRMHSILGNKWSEIAKLLPGRTDNHVKNFWNCHIKPRQQQVLSIAHEDFAPQEEQQPPLSPMLVDSNDTKNNIAGEDLPKSFHLNTCANTDQNSPGLVENFQKPPQLDYWVDEDDAQWSCYWNLMDDNAQPTVKSLPLQ